MEGGGGGGKKKKRGEKRRKKDENKKKPYGASPGLSKVPSFKPRVENTALHNMLCRLPGSGAYSFLPSPVHSSFYF